MTDLESWCDLLRSDTLPLEGSTPDDLEVGYMTAQVDRFRVLSTATDGIPVEATDAAAAYLDGLERARERVGNGARIREALSSIGDASTQLAAVSRSMCGT